MKNRKFYWRTVFLLVVLFTALAFSPLVLAPGKIHPKLFHLPYNLWMGILISIILVVLTFFGTLVHPGRED